MTAVRQPRLLVLANGAALDGVVQAEVTSTSHFAADRFRVQVALGADPQGVLADASALTLDIGISLDGGLGFTSLVQGAVDTLDIDPLAGTMELAGRDWSAGLIEARTQEIFANNTSGEIASALAARHGLAADVQATTTPVGRYWELEHDRIVLNQFGRATTEWDLLVTLARHEGFDLWVTGTTLHFRPPVAGAPATLRPVATLSGPANVTGLHLHRALTLARDIEVTVKSWNSRQGSAFAQTARRSGAAGHGPVQRYVYVLPNLAPDDAQAHADARLAELSRHERVIEAEMPGELSLAPRGTLMLEGTGTDFDQAYVIDRVERRLSVRSGFTQSLRAKNASPPAVPAIKGNV